MTTTEILKLLYANLNGATETAILFIAVFYDTFLGTSWRKKNNVAITSGGKLEGLKTSIPLALLPVIIWSFTILFAFVPPHIGGRDFIFKPFIFDIISLGVFLMIGNGMLKSILANARLAGYDLPSWAVKWVEDEYKVKLQKIVDEPNAASCKEETKNGI